MRSDRQTIRTRDGLELRRHDWPPAGARGTIVIVHGLGEHIDRYDHVARAPQRAGWTVVGYDHRGHGALARRSAAACRRRRLCADLGRVLDACAREHPRPAGAARPQPGRPDRRRASWPRACSRAAGRAGGAPVDALVLSSPALDPGMTPCRSCCWPWWRRCCPNLAVNNGLKVGLDLARRRRRRRPTPPIRWCTTASPAALGLFVVAPGPGGDRRRAALDDAHAADLGRRRPLRAPGGQRRLRGRRAARRGHGARVAGRCSTRSSTSPSKATCCRCWTTGWLDTLASFARTRSPP